MPRGSKSKRGGGRARAAAKGKGARRRSRSWLGWLAAVGVGAVVALVAVVGDRAPAAATVPESLKVRVVRSYPHATDAFTQGLLWHDGKLYESTGLEGRSSLREVDLETGEVVRRQDLEAELFAEGLARVGDRLIQITWHDGEALVWNLATFEHLETHRYEGPGWGLCFDGEHLVMSDGTATLTFRDPDTFEAQRRLRVTKVGRPVTHLNELECVDGSIWANVWQTDRLVRIDAGSGKVTATVDASGLLSPAERRGTDVLNGIAYHPDSGHLLLTGKLWPKVFEVELVARDE